MRSRANVDMEDDEVVSLEHEMSDEEEDEVGNGREHKDQLERLAQKDPEFYKFLKEQDKDLLDFEDDETFEDTEAITEQDTEAPSAGEGHKRAITMELVDSWCMAVKKGGGIKPVRNLLNVFRAACHYGEDSDDSSSKLLAMSPHVFTKVMSFVLSEMDGILRNILRLEPFEGKRETIMELKNTKLWKNFGRLVKSYLSNAFHALNSMTDPDMISFTLRRLRYSSVFLAAFPSLLRKFIKAVLNLWGEGRSTLPFIALVFLRDLCVRLGSDCSAECFRGICSTYASKCHFVNATDLQHINFLGNCVIELLRVDPSMAYQQAFSSIRQLAMTLREAMSKDNKETIRKVYAWKYINCLELWSRAVATFSEEADFNLLAYPLTQIISGVARLQSKARYFPLRLRCVRMLNRIAAATKTFIPVSLPLLDMLEMKELNRPPTGGVGQSVDLPAKLQVSTATLTTRSFQEACVFSVLEELAEHLSQWSYSVAFYELSFVPLMRLRSFCKHTKVERFRREMKQLIHQIEETSQFVNEKRGAISFKPNDERATTSFLEDEKKSGASPLTKYVITMRQAAQQRNKSLAESSIVVGEESSVFGKEAEGSDDEDISRHKDGARVFSSVWSPKNSKAEQPEEKKNKKKRKAIDEVAEDEDIVKDLVLSSDEEDGYSSDESKDESPPAKKNVEQEAAQKQNKRKRPPRRKNKKQKKDKDQKLNKHKSSNQKLASQKSTMDQKKNSQKTDGDSSKKNVHKKVKKSKSG